MDQKERGRVKRRNMIAKRMLVDQRKQYSERKIKDKTKQKPPKLNIRMLDLNGEDET